MTFTQTTVPYDTVSARSVSLQPMFSKCCCCIPIRLGCFILGYLNLALNTFHTLALLTVTTFIGISTHGFDHFDTNDSRHDITRRNEVGDQIPEVQSVEKPFLNQVGILLIVVLCVNFAWLCINIACLVGLHKKRPGPVRMYVGFATARFLLSLAGFIYLVMTSNAGPHTIISQSADLGLAAYFILVYYVYACQLERESAENHITHELSPNDISFIYPTKVDKQMLVAA